MSLLKPETRCKHLAQSIRPLAEQITKGFSPHVPRISMRREDWDLLLEKPEAARAEGFVIHGGRVTYQGIEIAPTNTTNT